MMRSPCCEKDHTNKGAWTKEEDERLVSYINAHGESSWRSLPISAGLNRCGKSCRLRWINYLRPDLKRSNFTPQEDQLIVSIMQFSAIINDCIKITGIYAMDHDRAITKVKLENNKLAFVEKTIKKLTIAQIEAHKMHIRFPDL
ncbi:hypothetical protein LXL04_017372 [Taraxacum kok-saghyz]